MGPGRFTGTRSLVTVTCLHGSEVAEARDLSLALGPHEFLSLRRWEYHLIFMVTVRVCKTKLLILLSSQGCREQLIGIWEVFARCWTANKLSLSVTCLLSGAESEGGRLRTIAYTKRLLIYSEIVSFVRTYTQYHVSYCNYCSISLLSFTAKFLKSCLYLLSLTPFLLFSLKFSLKPGICSYHC